MGVCALLSRPAALFRARARLALVVTLAVGGSLSLVQPAWSQTLPLTGESFDAFLAFRDEPGPVGLVEVSGECHPDASSTIAFRASGPATGPYPGTFTETGTVVLAGEGTGPVEQGSEARQVLDFDARFTIDSEVGEVTGEKEFLGDPDIADFGYCFETSIDPPSRHVAFVTDSRYRATITAITGTGTDSGTATVNLLADEEVAGFTRYNFNQRFVSDPTEPEGNTSGKSTGGGQIAGTEQSSPISFGFDAVSNEMAGSRGKFLLHGRCVVADVARDTTVKCLNVTSYVQVGTHATFRGEAEVNGDLTDYTISVDDLGEPNAGQDTFSITAGEYSAGGNVASGDVQVHQARPRP